jgi:hypothetical protein
MCSIYTGFWYVMREITAMKDFTRFPSIEQLEEKRLKAADLMTSAIAHASAFTANATPTSATTSNQLPSSAFQKASTPTAHLTAKEAEGASDSEGDNGDSENDNETQLSAALTATTGNQGSGTAQFKSKSEDGTTEREFKLNVSGVKTNGTSVTGTQEIRVGGVLVGSINFTNGSGKMELSTDADNDDTTLPSTFPTTVDSTTMVAVGPVIAPILTGTFATGTDSESLTELPNTNVSETQGSMSATTVPRSLAAGQFQSLASAPSTSSPHTARSAETHTVIEANSLAMNVLDAVHASNARLPDPTATATLKADDSTSQTNATDSPSLDAAFASLATDELLARSV